MKEFDVIVIGGGPAGCYAALTAATKGCSVALFEEHSAIGVPRHDPGWLMESDFTTDVIHGVDKAVPWMKVNEYQLRDSYSGELIEKSALGGYVVTRDVLDKEIAARAVKAGVSLYLKTRVKQLVRKEGKIEGIETNSDSMPRVGGKIFICADGIRSAGNGFAVTEGLCERTEVRTGISYLLANVGVSAGRL